MNNPCHSIEQTMSTADWIQILLLIVTVVGLIVTIINNIIQLKVLNKQMKNAFFADYTKRYQEIMLKLPVNIFKDDFDINALLPEEKAEAIKYFRAFFDLCSEELDLKKRKVIDQNVWSIWEDGIKYSFSKKAFKDAWGLINVDVKYYSEFSTWVNKHTSGL